MLLLVQIFVSSAVLSGPPPETCWLAERLEETIVTDIDVRRALLAHARQAEDDDAACAERTRRHLAEVAKSHHRETRKTLLPVHSELALELYEAALRGERDGGVAHALWFWRAELLWDLRRYAEAADSYEQAVRAAPRGPRAFDSAHARLLARHRVLDHAKAAKQPAREPANGPKAQDVWKTSCSWLKGGLPHALSAEEAALVEAADAFVDAWASDGDDESSHRQDLAARAAAAAAHLFAQRDRPEARARLESIMVRWPDTELGAWATVRLLDLLWVLDRHELFVVVESVAKNDVLMQDPKVAQAVAAARDVPP